MYFSKQYYFSFMVDFAFIMCHNNVSVEIKLVHKNCNVVDSMLLGELPSLYSQSLGESVCGFPQGITADLGIISLMLFSISFTSTFLHKAFTQLFDFLCFSKKMRLWKERFYDLASVLVEAVFAGKRENC